jgi:exodeoxyribonuclease VII small subunit
MVKTTVSVEDLSYEKALSELESILETLESETRDLETTLSLYERGCGLIRRCQDLLEKAELKVKILGENGQQQEMEKDL